MRRVLSIIILCLFTAGCAATGTVQKLETRAGECETARAETTQILGKMSAEIARLNTELQGKNLLLEEKEKKIEELRSRLAGFGVF